MSHQEFQALPYTPAAPSSSPTCSSYSALSEGEIMELDISSPTVSIDVSSPKADPSMEHFRQKYVLIHRLGAGDNGETYAAITKDHANRMLSLMRLGHPIDLLTKDVVVVKFYKSNYLEGDLTNEITFMKESLRDTHNLLTHAVESHHDGKTQWLALPYCNGGTLEKFMDTHPDAITTGFVWHAGIQLVQAACYLHFGIRDLFNDEMVRDWPMVYHGDIYTCNILLKAGKEDPYQYPDVVIADFGRAKTYNPEKERDVSGRDAYRANFVRDQHYDIGCIGWVMYFLRDIGRLRECSCSFGMCEACMARHQRQDRSEYRLDRWIHHLSRMQNRVLDSPTVLLKCLKNFVSEAHAELLKTKESMPLATANFFCSRNLKCDSIFEALTNFEAHDPAAHRIDKYFERHELPLMTAESQREVILRALRREAGELLPGGYNVWTDAIVERLAVELDEAAPLDLLCDGPVRTARVSRLLCEMLASSRGKCCPVIPSVSE